MEPGGPVERPNAGWNGGRGDEPMNGRFSRLELDAKHEAQAAASESVVLGTPIRTAEHDLAQAHEAYQSGQFERGLQLYTRALTQNRALIPAWVGQVQMLVELGEYREARLWSDKALDLFKNNGDLLAAKAQACFREQDRTSALVCSDASLQSPGCSPLRWRVRGETMLKAAPARARDCFDRSLTEASATWFDRVCIARVYLFYAKGAAGLEFAQSALDLEPRVSYCWFILGTCQESVGMTDKAAKSYACACQQSPKDEHARAALRRVTRAAAQPRMLRWFGGLFNK